MAQYTTAGDELLKKQEAENAAKTYALSPAGIKAALTKIGADAVKAADAAVADAKAKADAATKAANANVGVGPDAKADQAAAVAATKTLKEVKAIAKEIKINADPDVIAAKSLQKKAAEEVKATGQSLRTALANLETITSAMGEPSMEVTQALLDATKGLDTNAGLLGGVPNGPIGPTGVTGGNNATGGNGDTGDKPITSIKTPKYDSTGNFIGYEIKDSNGNITFEPSVKAKEKNKQYSWKNPTTGQTEYFDSPEEMASAVEVWKVQSGQVATNTETERLAAQNRAEALGIRTSAFDLLKNQFDLYGLGDLVEPLRALIQDENVSPSEYAIRLRQTQPYLKRFAANADRIKNGLAAITEAEYLQLEDQYQNIMRNYGLPESYYSKGQYGTQEGFQKFIANDVSATELEDRIMTAQQRVTNSNPEVLASLKAFYPGITNGDILAYTLDPKNALTEIKRKVTAAEIGGAATQAGLTTGMTRAEELGAAGITKEQARQGFQTVAEVAPRGGQLAAMYGESPYTQTTAEQEVFGLAGSTEAAKQRKKLTGLERASFSGQAGAAQGALAQNKAGSGLI